VLRAGFTCRVNRPVATASLISGGWRTKVAVDRDSKKRFDVRAVFWASPKGSGRIPQTRMRDDRTARMRSVPFDY
jgi:hypothetical protein